MNLRTDHGCDPVGERRDTVHEDPEAGKGSGRLHDTVECQAQGEDKSDNGRSRLCVWHRCDTQMGECTGVDEELNAEEQYQDLTLRVLNAGDCVVVACEDQNTHYDVVRNLNDDIGKHEGLPGVGFAGLLANLVQLTLCDKERHDLLHKSRENGTHHEDREDDVLETLGGAVRLEEGKTDEETCGNTEYPLGQDV